MVLVNYIAVQSLAKAALMPNNKQLISQQREGWQPRQFVISKICFRESACNRVLRLLLCSGGIGVVLVGGGKVLVT